MLRPFSAGNVRCLAHVRKRRILKNSLSSPTACCAPNPQGLELVPTKLDKTKTISSVVRGVSRDAEATYCNEAFTASD